MGTNSRYADAIDRRMDEKVLLAVSHSGPLQTLTAAELGVNEVPLTIDPAASTEGEAAGAVR